MTADKNIRINLYKQSKISYDFKTYKNCNLSIHNFKLRSGYYCSKKLCYNCENWTSIK